MQSHFQSQPQPITPFFNKALNLSDWEISWDSLEIQEIALLYKFSITAPKDYVLKCTGAGIVVPVRSYCDNYMSEMECFISVIPLSTPHDK